MSPKQNQRGEKVIKSFDIDGVSESSIKTRNVIH